MFSIADVFTLNVSAEVLKILRNSSTFQIKFLATTHINTKTSSGKGFPNFRPRGLGLDSDKLTCVP